MKMFVNESPLRYNAHKLAGATLHAVFSPSPLQRKSQQLMGESGHGQFLCLSAPLFVVRKHQMKHMGFDFEMGKVSP